MNWLQGFNCRREITPPDDGLLRIDVLQPNDNVKFTLEDGITEINPWIWVEGDNCFWVNATPNKPIYMYYNGGK